MDWVQKNWGGWIKATEQITDKYVVYSDYGLWEIDFYLNGSYCRVFGDFGTNMNLIANISVAQNKGPFSPGRIKTLFFQWFVIDYMRFGN